MILGAEAVVDVAVIVVAVPVPLVPVLVLVSVRDDGVLYKTFLTAPSTALARARASSNGSPVPPDILKLLIPRFDKVDRLLLWRLQSLAH